MPLHIHGISVPVWSRKSDKKCCFRFPHRKPARWTCLQDGGGGSFPGVPRFWYEEHHLSPGKHSSVSSALTAGSLLGHHHRPESEHFCRHTVFFHFSHCTAMPALQRDAVFHQKDRHWNISDSSRKGASENLLRNVLYKASQEDREFFRHLCSPWCSLLLR